MVYRIDPRLPVLWRDPTSVQVGCSPALVRLDDLTEVHERMLAALVTGASASALAMLAAGDAAARDAFLERVAPALEAPARAVEAVVAVCGRGPAADAVARALGGSGIRTVVSAHAEALLAHDAHLAILIGHFVLPPALGAAWLRRDLPHVPVVFDDSGVVAGPAVVPGHGACLRCLELHRRDADPAWVALASQLLGRTAATEQPLLAFEAAAAAARLAVALLGGVHHARSVRIDAATGVHELRTHDVHPECGCTGVPVRALSAARRGTGSARAASLATARRSRPTSGAASAARA